MENFTFSQINFIGYKTGTIVVQDRRIWSSSELHVHVGTLLPMGGVYQGLGG